MDGRRVIHGATRRACDAGARRAVDNPEHSSVRQWVIGVEEALGVAGEARGACVRWSGIAWRAERQGVVADDEDVLDAAVLDRGVIERPGAGGNAQGLSAHDLKDRAAKHPDAPASIRIHKHYIYNVLANLRKDGVITRSGERYMLAKPQGGVH